MKTCSHAKFHVQNCYGYWVTLLHEEAEEEDEEFVKIMFYLYFIPGAIFSFYFHSIFCMQLVFLHVLHLDVLNRQIEIETESEN